MFLFHLWRCSPTGSKQPHCWNSISHKIRQTLVTTPLKEWSAHPRGRYLHNIQQA